MASTASLFASLPRSRPRRVLMRVVDAGDCGGGSVHLKCPRCGHDAGWQAHASKREAQSQPCPVCTGGTHGE